MAADFEDSRPELVISILSLGAASVTLSNKTYNRLIFTVK